MEGAQGWVRMLSQRLELPADILTGMPRIEWVGNACISIETHRGLLEYDRTKISVASKMGRIEILGQELRIQLMNVSQITVCGRIRGVCLQEEDL